MSITTYQDWIKENFDTILELRNEYAKWQKLYKHKAFEVNWADSIHKLLASIRKAIEADLKECEYYMSRIKELEAERDQACLSQLRQDQGNVAEPREESRDTDQEFARIEQEAMGSALEEVDDNWG